MIQWCKIIYSPMNSNSEITELNELRKQMAENQAEQDQLQNKLNDLKEKHNEMREKEQAIEEKLKERLRELQQLIGDAVSGSQNQKNQKNPQNQESWADMAAKSGEKTTAVVQPLRTKLVEMAKNITIEMVVVNSPRDSKNHQGEFCITKQNDVCFVLGDQIYVQPSGKLLEFAARDQRPYKFVRHNRAYHKGQPANENSPFWDPEQGDVRRVPVMLEFGSNTMSPSKFPLGHPDNLLDDWEYMKTQMRNDEKLELFETIAINMFLWLHVARTADRR